MWYLIIFSISCWSYFCVWSGEHHWSFKFVSSVTWCYLIASLLTSLICLRSTETLLMVTLERMCWNDVFLACVHPALGENRPYHYSSLQAYFDVELRVLHSMLEKERKTKFWQNMTSIVVSYTLSCQSMIKLQKCCFYSFM